MRRVGLFTAVLLVVNALVLALPARHADLAPAPGQHLRVGLVFDVGGRGDKSFNDAAYRGVERAARELGVEVNMIEPGDGADRESGIRMLAAARYDLVIGVGFIFSDDVYAAALAYPQVKFACIDYAKFDEHGFVTPPANMLAIKFREEEGAFLVGALAALTSKSGAIGFVGGMQIPLIEKFAAGYAAGAHEVCPTCRVFSAYAGITPDAFKNPTKGQRARRRAISKRRRRDLSSGRHDGPRRVRSRARVGALRDRCRQRRVGRSARHDPHEHDQSRST